MGCSECKQKKTTQYETQQNGDGSETINENINFNNLAKLDGTKGNYLLKFVILIVVTLALPFVMVILVGQIFLQFFMPKFIPIIAQKTNNFFTNLLNIYAIHRAKRQIKKREKQFANSTEYDGIEVFNNNNNE